MIKTINWDIPMIYACNLWYLLNSFGVLIEMMPILKKSQKSQKSQNSILLKLFFKVLFRTSLFIFDQFLFWLFGSFLFLFCFSHSFRVSLQNAKTFKDIEDIYIVIILQFEWNGWLFCHLKKMAVAVGLLVRGAPYYRNAQG